MPRPSEKYDVVLPMPDNVQLPIVGPAYQRPDKSVLEQLTHVSSATASATLHRMGLRQTFMHGPIARTPGAKVVGPAVTLQFMPQREDIASGAGQEQAEKVSALWSVFDAVEPGDVLVVQAWGDPYTGCMGDMLTTYFKGRGGAGVVVDGCVRDWPKIRELGVPMWTKGVTPNYASQATLFPWAYNVPIACSRVLVMPGDIIIADDDGAVMVPAKMAKLVAEATLAHEEWEVFSRIKLLEGGSIRKYYPLNDEGWAEYEEWKRSQPGGGIVEPGD
jgi:regulator of RNase E activity RraA